jgi:signal peptidase II
MAKPFFVIALSALGVFIIDQNIKMLFLNGFNWYGNYFSLILTFNKGVAFSMFAFLEDNLKYIQLVLILGICSYLFFHKQLLKIYALPIGIILGAGCSNLYDRFVYGGVVDYFFWHKWFEFAVFNFADVMINIGVVLILFFSFYRKEKGAKENI